MSTTLKAAVFAAVVIAASTGQASAAGWQGGEHGLLRAEMAQGFTLTRLWKYLESRDLSAPASPSRRTRAVATALRKNYP